MVEFAKIQKKNRPLNADLAGTKQRIDAPRKAHIKQITRICAMAQKGEKEWKDLSVDVTALNLKPGKIERCVHVLGDAQEQDFTFGPISTSIDDEAQVIAAARVSGLAERSLDKKERKYLGFMAPRFDLLARERLMSNAGVNSLKAEAGSRSASSSTHIRRSVLLDYLAQLLKDTHADGGFQDECYVRLGEDLEKLYDIEPDCEA